MSIGTGSVAKVSSAVCGPSVSTLPCRNEGMTYSRFIEGLKAAGIEADRKILSDLAITDAAAFSAIVAQAKKALEAKHATVAA
jgi:hypothetical protein